MATQIEELDSIIDDRDAGLWEVVKTFYGIAIVGVAVLVFVGAMAMRDGDGRHPATAVAAGAPVSSTQALVPRNLTIYFVDSPVQAADVSFADQLASSILDATGHPMPGRSFHVLQAGTPEEMAQAQTEVLRIVGANGGTRSVIELVDVRRR
ncbi:MAG TPA: hypothetical protein VI759_10735 [Dehalococcoidia bacterium]|nr:hypothetical protein [Dehalococcoidia bacterium]